MLTEYTMVHRHIYKNRYMNPESGLLKFRKMKGGESVARK